MDMTKRPYETCIFNDDLGTFHLFYITEHGGESKPVLTPGGNPIKHISERLLTEIQAELKSGTPQQMIEQISNYQIICSQIDEFGKNTFHEDDCDFHQLLMENGPEERLTQLLMEDSAFFPMHPQEEVDRAYNLQCLTEFLEENFGESRLDSFLISSPIHTREIWGRDDFPGKKFEGLRDLLYKLIIEASLEQRVVLHTAFHTSMRSLVIPVLLTFHHLLPQQFALACLACGHIIPDILDDEEMKDILTFQVSLSNIAAMLTSYLNLSVPGIVKLISNGESSKLEFKSSLRKNLKTGSRKDSNVQKAALKEIVGFLNSDGGDLLIGVTDSGEIVGIEVDEFLDPKGSLDKDKYMLHLTDLIRTRIDSSIAATIKLEFYSVNGKHVLQVTCPASRDQIYYLDGDFYIRMASQTVKLEGRDLINHISQNTGKKPDNT